MCDYCETVMHTGRKVTEVDECELMMNLPVLDDFTELEIIQGDSEPAQYIRKYKNKYFIVTEFADPDGNVLLLPISNCPICGRKLGV